MGALANITQEGFPPSAFHSYPATLRIDGITGDYGPGFLGHVLGVSSYLVHDPEFGWMGFGGNVTVAGDTVRFEPVDAARSRLFVAPVGLWITLDAGTIESTRFHAPSGRLTIILSPASSDTPRALLRIERPARDSWNCTPGSSVDDQREALVIPLGSEMTTFDMNCAQ